MPANLQKQPAIRSKMAMAAAFAALMSAAPASARSDAWKTDYQADGEPVRCLHLSQIRQTHVRDDRTIDFEVSGKKMYRNTLPNKCPGLGFEERFMFKTSLNELCSVDTITVLNTFGGGLMQGATCGLGEFQPIRKVEKSAP